MFQVDKKLLKQLIPYIKDEIKKGTRLNQIMRHTLGLISWTNWS